MYTMNLSNEQIGKEDRFLSGLEDFFSIFSLLSQSGNFLITTINFVQTVQTISVKIAPFILLNTLSASDATPPSIGAGIIICNEIKKLEFNFSFKM